MNEVRAARLTIKGVADLRYERLNMPVIETDIHKGSEF
jgi:hypothetical protein